MTLIDFMFGMTLFALSFWIREASSFISKKTGKLVSYWHHVLLPPMFLIMGIFFIYAFLRILRTLPGSFSTVITALDIASGIFLDASITFLFMFILVYPLGVTFWRKITNYKGGATSFFIFYHIGSLLMIILPLTIVMFFEVSYISPHLFGSCFLETNGADRLLCREFSTFYNRATQYFTVNFSISSISAQILVILGTSLTVISAIVTLSDFMQIIKNAFKSPQPRSRTKSK